jgi:hypothetical protein
VVKSANIFTLSIGVLNEMSDGEVVKLRLIWRWHQVVEWLDSVPRKRSSRKRALDALGLVASVIFTVGPLGYSMLDNHPCEAWAWFTVALVSGSYSVWQLTPAARWIRLAILIGTALLFGFYGRRSIYSETQLDFFFVNPGAFSASLGPNGPPGWILIVSGENAHKPLFNSFMRMRDEEMIGVAKAEADKNVAAQLITHSYVERNYPEIDRTSPGDKILWIPENVNTQEYTFYFTYRVGDQSFQGNEDLRIVNTGPQITFANRMTVMPIFQESITVTNQAGEILMHCVDKDFPHDSRWVDGHPCFPSKGSQFAPLPRTLCKRCFGRGFVFAEPD